MIKINDYSVIESTNGCFHDITFITDGGYKIHFTVHEDGNKYFTTDTATIEEIKQAIAIIESGKLEIEL